MPSSSGPANGATPLVSRRWVRLAILLAGILALQFALFWPSLVGGNILLPAEVLTGPSVYIPPSVATPPDRSIDETRLDLVLQFEPERQFAARELAAHRWPRWLPYQYGGVPMRFTLLSPLFLLKAATQSPHVLAWAKVVVALIAGAGAYRFFRDALGLSFWSSTIAAWAYSISGFFVLWQGFPVADTICWFPWLLASVDAVVARRNRWWLASVAFFAAMELVSGQLDVGALAIGTTIVYASIFAAWFDVGRNRRIPPSGIAAASTAGSGDPALHQKGFHGPIARLRALLRIFIALGLGVLLAAPYVLPYVEYARTGGRIAERAQGQREERSPEGITAVPLVVWPDMSGTSRSGSLFFGNGNQEESAATAYAGTFLALFLAPLAWFSRRHRAFNIVCAVAIVLGIGWCANLPGWVSLLRLRGFNLLSFNRLTFVTGFALVAQAAIGLEALTSGACRRSRWLLVPGLCALVVAGFCGWRAHALPEPLATQLGQTLAQGQSAGWVRSTTDLILAQHAFAQAATFFAVAAALAALFWLLLAIGPRAKLWSPAAALLALGELLAFGHGRVTQPDAALYYPPVPSLARLEPTGSDRVAGFFCFPANLAETQGWNDVRGYDPVEPGRMTELVKLGAHPRSPTLSYTSLQWFAPAVTGDASGRIRLPPVLDLLGVRYVICRGSAPPGMRVKFAGDDYWGVENERALPRAFVPTHVTLERDSVMRLRAMAAPSFNPKQEAYVEEPLTVASAGAGTATIALDEPTHVRVAVSTEAPSLLVLADRWDAGWRATLDGKTSPIVVADHALRGVVVPAGKSLVEFEYAPASTRIGWWCASAAVLILAALCLAQSPRSSRRI